jgi:SAM-dependent methyltransferase
MYLKKKVYFEHSQNKMNQEGDILSARKYFFSRKNKNLYYLLKNRYSWMNNFINGSDTILELGSGASLLKEFIVSKNLKTSDFTNYDFLDYKNVDATKTNFKDGQFDKVISSNLIHHLAFPLKHFKEVLRILKPNGYYIIQEGNCSLLCQFFIILMKHEGYNFETNPLNEDEPCNDKNDLWSANAATPNLIFKNFDNFNKTLNNEFKIIKHSYNEIFCYLNSGGVIAKTKYIPMNEFFFNLILMVDKLLSAFPKIFPLQQSIVLKKV